MQLFKITPIHTGKFINRYNLHYKTSKGNEKIYEFVSMNPNLTIEDVKNNKCNAVSIVAFNEDFSKVCINKEFRLTTNSEIYGFPAGMVDSGEDVLIAARRELKEETGLVVKEFLDILPPSFSAIGVSNEKTGLIFCVAKGEPINTFEEYEEIEPFWCSKEQAKEICKTDICASRTQLFLYLWANNLIKIEKSRS